MNEQERKRVKPSNAMIQTLESEILKLKNEGEGLTAISIKLGISRGSVYGFITKARKKISDKRIDAQNTPEDQP